MSQDTTLAVICDQATDAGAYISDNAAFEVIVSNAAPGQGKVPSKALLTDPNNPNVFCNGARFGGSFVGMEGCVIRVIGKSIKAKRYNGNVDLTIGDKASVTKLGTAPASNAAPARQPQQQQSKEQSAAQQPVGDPEAHFHKEMGKIALSWLHAFQYMRDVSAKIDSPILSPDLFQAGVSSLFIEANRRGLGHRVPKLRAADEKGGFVRFVAPKPESPTPEQIEAEAKARAAAAAAEEEHRHKEEMAARAKQNQDEEDVPF